MPKMQRSQLGFTMQAQNFTTVPQHSTLPNQSQSQQQWRNLNMPPQQMQTKQQAQQYPPNQAQNHMITAQPPMAQSKAYPQQQFPNQAQDSRSYFQVTYQILRDRDVKSAMRNWTNFTPVYLEMKLQQLPARFQRLKELEDLTDKQRQLFLGLLQWEGNNHFKLRNHMKDLYRLVMQHSGQQQIDFGNTTFARLSSMAHQCFGRSEKWNLTRTQTELCLYQLPPQIQHVQNSCQLLPQIQLVQNSDQLPPQIHQTQNSLLSHPHAFVRQSEKRKHGGNDAGDEGQRSSRRPKIQPDSPYGDTSAQAGTGLLTPPEYLMDGSMDFVQPQPEDHLHPPERSRRAKQFQKLRTEQPKAEQEAERVKAKQEAEQVKAKQEAERVKAKQLRQAEKPWYAEDEARRERNLKKNAEADKACRDCAYAQQVAIDAQRKRQQDERNAKLRLEEEAREAQRNNEIEAQQREKAKQDAEKAKQEAARLEAEEDERVRLAEVGAAAPKLCEHCKEHGEALKKLNEEIADHEIRHAKLVNVLLKGRVQKEIDGLVEEVKKLVESSKLKVQADRQIEQYWKCEHFMEVEPDSEQEEGDFDDLFEDGDDYTGSTEDKEVNNEPKENGTSTSQVEHNQPNDVEMENPEIDDDSDLEAALQKSIDESESDDEDNAPRSNYDSGDDSKDVSEAE